MLDIFNSIPVILAVIGLFVFRDRAEVILAFIYCGFMQNLLSHYYNFRPAIDYPVIGFIAIALASARYVIFQDSVIRFRPAIIKFQYLFAFMLLLGLLFREGNYHDTFKPFAIFISTAMVPFFYFAILPHDTDRIKRFLVYFGIFSIIGALITSHSIIRFMDLSTYLNPIKAQSIMKRSEDITLNNILLARQVGHGIIFSIVGALFLYRHRAINAVLGISIVFLFLCLIVINERGPFYGLLIIPLSWLIISRISRFSFLRKIPKFQTVIMLAVLSYYVTDFIGRFYLRLEHGLSSERRIIIYKDAIAHFLDNPVIGSGYGYSNTHLGSSSAHNIILQIGVDNGIIGIVIFSAVIALTLIYATAILKGTPKEELKYLTLLVLTLFLYDFLQAQVSGDINAGGILWIEMGIITALYMNHTTIMRYALRRSVPPGHRAVRAYQDA